MWQHSNKLIPLYGWLAGLSPLRFIFCNLWLVYVGTRTRNLVDYMGFTLHNSLSLASIIFFACFAFQFFFRHPLHVSCGSRMLFRGCLQNLLTHFSLFLCVVFPIDALTPKLSPFSHESFVAKEAINRCTVHCWT